jgi:hypothetical protein
MSLRITQIQRNMKIISDVRNANKVFSARSGVETARRCG